MAKKKETKPEKTPAPKKPRKKAAPKGPTVLEYIEELKKMVETRTGRPFEIWLLPQARLTAMNLVILDGIQFDIEHGERYYSMQGSMGQQKIESNPLYVTYDKLQRTLTMQLSALGLNHNTAKGKVSTAEGESQMDDDPVLAALMKR